MARTYKIQVLPGDGIGVETVKEAVKVLSVTEEVTRGLNLSFHEFPCGGKHYLETGKEWTEEAKRFSQEEADAILFGAVGWEKSPGEPVRREDGSMAGADVVLGTRMRLDLYANVRPVKLYEGVPSPLATRQPSDIDFVIIRENTEGLYAPIRGTLQRGETAESAVDVRVITRRGAERVSRFAFNLARQRRHGAPADGQQRVTCVDKSNVLDGCRLFRRVFEEVAQKFPKVMPDFAYVDAWAMWCLRRPSYYDVVVAPNMFGDIISDLGAAIQGGMGVAAGGNIGERHAMFEPIHGSAPRHAGKQKANPIAAILAGKMLLEWLGDKYKDRHCHRAAEKIGFAVAAVLSAGRTRTYDLCIGSYADVEPSTTGQVGSAVAEAVRPQS
ncbi:MAG: isocitrate/isopropylmalate dehydrogenase family protein [Promethearchaeota archaeon]